MAKNCSYCGKQLTFRDSFVWDKKPVCRACLDNLEQDQKVKPELVKQGPSTKVQITNSNHIGSTGIYLSFLFGGLLVCFLGGVISAENDETGGVIIGLGVIAVIIAMIYFFVLLYQVWRFVINESQSNNLVPSIETPGKAVGYCFIPFYNFYWVFQVFGKFPKDFNVLSAKKGSNKVMSEGLGSAIPILVIISIIPFIGYVTAFINFLILYPIFISQAVRLCKEFD